MKKYNLIILILIILTLVSCNGNNHEHSYIEKHDTEYHWLECLCGNVKDKALHYGGDATCKVLAKCEVCGENYGELLKHNYVNFVYDEQHHYYECECKEHLEKYTHNFNEGVVTKYQTDKELGIKKFSCTDCDYYFIEDIPMIDGKEVSIYPSLSNADIVSYDGRIYTYGGSPDGSARTNSIYCYDTNTDKIYKLAVRLNNESTSHRVLLVGSKVYIFGGINSNGQLNTILVHDLEAQTLSQLEVDIPFGANCFQIGSYENKMYIVGGYLGGKGSNNIYEFDLETYEFKQLDITLPKALFKGAWCSVGKYMYLIGGTDGKRSNEIYRFDMIEHTIMKMNATLPEYLSQSRAVYDNDDSIYIYGGTNEKNQLTDYVLKYKISEDICVVENCQLPLSLANTCVTFLNNAIYILGGDNNTLNVILKHEKNAIISLR